MKSAVNEAKDPVVAGKSEACIAKLNKGIELIDQRQKLILISMIPKIHVFLQHPRREMFRSWNVVKKVFAKG